MGQSTFAVAAPGGTGPHRTQLSSLVPDWAAGLRTQLVPPPHAAGSRNRLATLKDSLIRLQRNYAGPAAEQHRTSAARPPRLLTGFYGFDLPGVPNDDDLAVSDAGQVVSVMNGRVAVHAENGALLQVQSLAAFAGVPGTVGFDPHVLFDPAYQRFVVVFLTGHVASQSRIHVVVSATPDALGPWQAYQLSGNPLNDGTWTDYPGVALTQDELLISGNTFTDGSQNNAGFRQSTIWQLNKHRLMSGQALQAADTRYYHGITHNGQAVFNHLPVRGGRGPGALPAHFLSSDAVAAQNSQRLLLVQVTSGLGASPALNVRACAGMPAYTLPPSIRQRGSTLLLGRNDARVHSAFIHDQRIQFVLNVLHTSGPPRAAVCYGQISNLGATTPTVQALLLPETRDAAFPAIVYCGLHPSDHSALIAYAHASPTEYPGYSAVFVDNAGELSMPLTLHTGTGFLAIWGDYTGLCPRYNRPGEVWVQSCVSVTSGAGGGERVPHISRLLHPDILTALGEPAEKSSLAVYPNPAGAYVQTAFTLVRGSHTCIKLLDVRGRPVTTFLQEWVRAGKSTLRFSTAHLPAGVYLLRIESQQEPPQTQRLTLAR